MNPSVIPATNRTQSESLDDRVDSLLATIARETTAHSNNSVPEWAWQASWTVEEPVTDEAAATELLSSRVMIVDDEPINVKLAKKLISELGYSEFVTLTDSREAMDTLRQEQPDLLLLDLMMPHLSGLDILNQMQSDETLRQIPVIMLTASADRDTRLEALECGATDFLAKPVDPAELALRTKNALLMRSYQTRLLSHAKTLEQTVRTRTRELCWSRLELVGCLARAAEYRDDDTGKHVIRVGRYAAVIARAAEMPDEFSEMLEVAAQLHDVGKIGIPDSVLLKPGRLNDEELKQMRMHTDLGGSVLNSDLAATSPQFNHHAEIGARILNTSQSPLSKMAASIALTHHEKWDGSGYPLGLAGTTIPIEGRITAIADVFDALRSKRPYKEPFSLDRSFDIMTEERGFHFDPDLLDLFLDRRSEIEKLDAQFSDTRSDDDAKTAT